MNSETNTHSVDRVKPRYRSEYTEDAWKVTVNLPGVVKDDLHISIENEILEISGLRKNEHPESWKRLSGSGNDKSYELRLDVGPEVDDQRIEAKLENGQLTLTLPLKEESKPRQIPVN